MEIVRERLEREFDLVLISTAPNVVYRTVSETGTEMIVTNPSEFPDGKIGQIFEPIVRANGAGPQRLHRRDHGALPGAPRACCWAWSTCRPTGWRSGTPCRWGRSSSTSSTSSRSRTRGYASLDYEPDGEQEANLVKVDILLQGVPVDAFSQIVHTDKAREYGLAMTSRLKELIPRQQFEVPIQAANRLAGHRPREHPRDPQGRAGQVLRR